MFSNKQAISPVISISLILVMAVISVVGYQNWFTNFNSQILTDVETKTSQNSQISVQGIYNNKLYLNSNSNQELSLLKISNQNSQICEFDNSIQINKTNLIGHWKFETANSTIQDLSGNNNYGKLYGDTVFLMDFNNNIQNKANYNFTFLNKDTTFQNSNCISNSCVTLDGTDSSTADLQINNSKNLNLSKPFSISVWINKFGNNQNTQNQNRSFILAFKGASTTAYLSTEDISNVLRFEMKNTTGYPEIFETTSTISNNVWNHILISYNGSNLKFYLNGNLEINQDYYNFIGDYNNFLIGSNVPGNHVWSQKFNGSIDELSIYQKVLTQNEINQLYNSKKAQFIEFNENGLNFNGESTYVNITSNQLLSLGNESLTMYAQLTPNNFGNYQLLSSRGTDQSEKITWRLVYRNLMFDRYPASGGSARSDFEILGNENVYLSSVFDKENQIVNHYFNNLNETHSYTEQYTGTNPTHFLIGAMMNDGEISRHYTGSIKEVMIFNQTLTNFEIENLKWNSIKKLNNQINQIDISSCNLEKNQRYKIFGITNNGNKFEQEIISK